MARVIDRGKKHRMKPWRASRKRRGTEFFLGYYATKKEAEQREKEFEESWSPRT